MKILIIEDETKVASFIRRGFEEQTYEVTLAFDGNMGLRYLSNQSYDVVVLDANIPHVNGFEVTKQVRQLNISTPIIMLTALGTTTDKLAGFDAGVDDYLVKPFEFKELLARVRALYKRSHERLPAGNHLKVGDLELNVDEKLAIRNGNRIELTAKEYSLLEYLIRNKGKVISRVDIAEKVWEINFDTGTNIIDVYVNLLRKKIDKEYDKKLLHTVVGMGYIIKD